MTDVRLWHPWLRINHVLRVGPVGRHRDPHVRRARAAAMRRATTKEGKR